MLIDNCRVLKFPARKIIYKQGKLKKKAYCLLKGKVELLKQYEQSEGDYPVAIVLPGATFGEESLLLLDKRREDTAIALDESFLLEITNLDKL